MGRRRSYEKGSNFSSVDGYALEQTLEFVKVSSLRWMMREIWWRRNWCDRWRSFQLTVLHTLIFDLSDSSKRRQLCASLSSTSGSSDRCSFFSSISHGRFHASIVQGKSFDLWTFEGVTKGRKTVIISQNQKGRKGRKQENPFRDELIFPRWAFSSSFSRLFNDRQNQRLHHKFEGVDSLSLWPNGETDGRD